MHTAPPCPLGVRSRRQRPGFQVLKCWLHGHTWFHGSGRKTARAGAGLWGIGVQNTPAALSSRRPLSLTAAHAPPRRSLEAEAAAAGGGELGAQLRSISTKQPWDRQPHRLIPRGVWRVPLPSLAEGTCHVNSCPGCGRAPRWPPLWASEDRSAAWSTSSSPQEFTSPGGLGWPRVPPLPPAPPSRPSSSTHLPPGPRHPSPGSREPGCLPSP